MIKLVQARREQRKIRKVDRGIFEKDSDKTCGGKNRTKKKSRKVDCGISKKHADKKREK